jgi:hypothetical protein
MYIVKEDYRDVACYVSFTQDHKQKSSPDKSDELLNIVRGIFRSIDLTYLSASRRMELAPFSEREGTRIEEVVKASQGHNPQPFLISNCKELVQRKNADAVFPN